MVRAIETAQPADAIPVINRNDSELVRAMEVVPTV
jgi:hypothetical protein